MDQKQGAAKTWREHVPDAKDRVALRRARLGLIAGTKNQMARASPLWHQLEAADQHEVLACPCGGGAQDAAHVMMTCGDTVSLREEVESAVRAAVTQGTADDVQRVSGWTQEECVEFSLRTKPTLTRGAETSAKSASARAWRMGLEAVSRRLKAENADTTAETAARAHTT